MSGDASIIILTGGTGARLGGADKASLIADGQTLLDRILSQTTLPVVVAGREAPTVRPVLFRPEDPPLGGPVAGIAAALEPVDTTLVGILAVDMPDAVPVLDLALAELRGHGGVDVVVPVDARGRRQPLCSAWRTAALRSVLPADPHGQPMRSLLGQVTVREWEPALGTLPREDVVVSGHLLNDHLLDDHLLDDIDTPEDLDRYRQRRSSRHG